MIYEQLQKKKFNLIDYRFYPVTSIRKLDTLSNHNSAFGSVIPYADVIVPNQYQYNLLTDTDGTTVYLGEYNYVDNTYKLEYQLVLKKLGPFVFKHESYIDLQYAINRTPPDFEGKCDDS